MSKWAAVGIDIGGTKTLCVLVDKKCRVLEQIKFKTAPQDGQRKFTERLLDAVRHLELHTKAKGLKLAGIGVACAGTVDHNTCKIVSAPNLLCLEGYPVGRILHPIHKNVLIENDVQAGIIGEHRLGAAKGATNVLGVFFGTGVGGSAIINGEVYRGSSGVGGQVGSILAQPVGGLKAALSHGMLDRIASKAAIAGEALVMAVKEWAPYLHKKVGTDLSLVTWGILKKAIEHGDTRVDEMLRARMHVVGIALSGVVNFLNPDMVVLGGGLSQEMPQLVLKEVEMGMREYLGPEVNKVLKVRLARLGSEAVAMGGAYQALNTWVYKTQK
jgi:glucokinase